MIKKFNFNPKLNKTFILGRGLNNSIKENIKITNKNKINTLPLEHQMFLKSLINKTGKGFKKI
jgi:hypothetical protein